MLAIGQSQATTLVRVSGAFTWVFFNDNILFQVILVFSVFPVFFVSVDPLAPGTTMCPERRSDQENFSAPSRNILHPTTGG
jgi:magnesium-transporting ATPase (P-type)